MLRTLSNYADHPNVGSVILIDLGCEKTNLSEVEKYLLKEAVRDLLPETIIARPKSGMLVPVEAWFQGPLLPHARARLLDGLARYDLFERPYLERLLAGRLGGLRPRHGAKIWLLVTLESWLRNVFR